MPVSARYAPEDQVPATRAGPGTLNLVPKIMGPRTLRLVPSWDPGPGTRLVPNDHGSWNPALGAQLKTRVLEQECDCLEPYGPANNKGQEPLRREPAGASHLVPASMQDTQPRAACCLAQAARANQQHRCGTLGSDA